MADLAIDRAADPDVQAAVTDFLDYTEYFPADLIRSLTLIRGLDETYRKNSHNVHDLTKIYGSLPSQLPPTKPDAKEIRLKISTHLDNALVARSSAYAEACRLFDLADRHQDRLKSIIAKLHAIPKPPSRDPTPQPPNSAHGKRPRGGRKSENGTSAPRLTLNPPRGNASMSAMLHRPRGRRVTVPGEVMPPYDPDEPMASTEVSDRESSAPPSPVRPVLKLKPPKLPKEKVPMAEKVRAPREPTVAYRKPTPPPEDAELGTKYRPWTHLTEYEMYRLRKKMKKNHNWEPSDVMIRRELAERGRGWENYYKAKAEAQSNGVRFIDIDNSDKSPAKSESVQPSTIISLVPSAVSLATPNTKLQKALKSHEMKPSSPASLAREKATQAAQEAEQAARRLGDVGSTFRNLFNTAVNSLTSSLSTLNRNSTTPIANGLHPADKKAAATEKSKKRKHDEILATASPSTDIETQKKKQKTIAKPSPLTPSDLPAPSAGTIKIPLKLTVAPQVAVASKSTTPAPPPTRPASMSRASTTLKIESSPPAISRPSSHRSAAASVEPSTTPLILTSRGSRRSSVTSTTNPKSGPEEPALRLIVTAASHRSKRDAPGTVTQSSQDGGAAVSVSKRKSKPSKQSKPAQTPKASVEREIRVDIDGREEIVDPEEERYCVCGDVSWGEMICCELEEKCEFGQWFHMECIQLPELPPRTVKWYCPGDRKKYHKGENSNGLVGRGIK